MWIAESIPSSVTRHSCLVVSFLRLIFLQKWKGKLKIWNSRNQENFVFIFVSS